MGFHFTKHEKYPNQILIRVFTGIVRLSVIMDSWKYMDENQLVTPETKGIINDLRECRIKLSMKEFFTVRQYLSSHKGLNKIKLAVVTDSPKNIVFPFMLVSQITNISVRPFTTYEAAENWVLS